MDEFIAPGAPGFDGHQYGAYLFVQWVLHAASLPGSAEWAFLRASFLRIASGAPAADTPAVDTALDQALTLLPPNHPCLSTLLGCEVASFWGDETNSIHPAPMFGHPPGKINTAPIDQATEKNVVPPADQYGAFLLAMDDETIEAVRRSVSGYCETMWART